jgi:hypothetical protein
MGNLCFGPPPRMFGGPPPRPSVGAPNQPFGFLKRASRQSGFGIMQVNQALTNDP